MAQIGCDFRQRLQDKGIVFDFVTRDLQAAIIDNEVGIENEIKVEGSGRKLFTVTGSAVIEFDLPENFGHTFYVQVGVETYHQIIKIVAAEADRFGFVDAGDGKVAEMTFERAQTGGYVAFLLDIAAYADITPWHKLSFAPFNFNADITGAADGAFLV